MKPTAFITNDMFMATKLRTMIGRCSGDHVHAHLTGGLADLGRVYPPRLVSVIQQGITASIKDPKKQRHAFHATSCQDPWKAVDQVFVENYPTLSADDADDEFELVEDDDVEIIPDSSAGEPAEAQVLPDDDLPALAPMQPVERILVGEHRGLDLLDETLLPFTDQRSLIDFHLRHGHLSVELMIRFLKSSYARPRSPSSSASTSHVRSAPTVNETLYQDRSFHTSAPNPSAAWCTSTLSSSCSNSELYPCSTWWMLVLDYKWYNPFCNVPDLLSMLDPTLMTPTCQQTL